MKRLLSTIVCTLALSGFALADIQNISLGQGHASPIGGAGGGDGGGIAIDPAIYTNLGSVAAGSIGGVFQPRMMDGGAFGGPDAAGPCTIDSITLGFSVRPGQVGTFDLGFRIYDNFNTGASPVNSSQLSPNWYVSYTGLAAGSYTTGAIVLPVTGANRTLVPDGSYAVDVQMFVAGTGATGGVLLPGNTVTSLLGSITTGPSLGTSPDGFYQDVAPTDGTYSNTELFNFAAPNNRANMYLQLTPEPASMTLLAIGALFAARRARRA